MDSPTPALLCTFSALGSDVKLDIFDFVRSKPDQGNARLVSRVFTCLLGVTWLQTDIPVGMESTNEAANVEKLYNEHARHFRTKS